VVQQRRQLGHWESDTVIARHSKAALHVVVERKTRLTKITKVDGCTAQATRSALNRRLSHYPQAARRTITYDNGKENVQHTRVNQVLGTRSFFCEPFHSWEKGTVENTIGLIRRIFPKKTKFDSVTTSHVKKLERQLNNRPRKSLLFKTPNEVFRTSVALTH
jgi:IS30 family transposase